MLTPEQIQANFETFRELCAGIPNRSKNLLALIDHFNERLALCPASSRKSFHRSIPGGLVEHSLRVLQNAIRLNKTFKWDLDKSSLVIASLMHDIGKIGNEDQDYYVKNETWKAQKYGDMYQVNYDLPFMETPHRSVYLMQSFGVKLSCDEYLAILLNDGFVVEANKNYCLKCPQLATCIMTADYISTCWEKDEEHTQENADKNKPIEKDVSKTKD